MVGDDVTAPRTAVVGALHRDGRTFLRVRTSEAVGSTDRITRTRTADGRRLALHPQLPAALPRGVRLVPLGALPMGTFTVRLRLRDPTGNTTELTRRLRISAAATRLMP
ncbi:MAG: hypothetical protein U0Y82_03445 [Thermoleophilia bacterium]